MRLITIDDFIETYGKLKQRGVGFILSKFSFNSKKRVQSAFDHTSQRAWNSWSIEKVVKRWNKLKTGDFNLTYEDYIVDKYFKGETDLKILSLGGGDCLPEIQLATYNTIFSEVTCVDMSTDLLDIAREKSKAYNLDNIHFINEDIYEYNFKDEYYDIVLFNFSLHHFKNIGQLLRDKVKPALKPNGYLIIDEYVGPDRLQLPVSQRKAITEALQIIPKEYRKRSNTNFYRNKMHGSGLIRVILADPSECVESSTILPEIHKQFSIIEEKSIGGNIIVHALKDISNHFVPLTKEKEIIVDKLFEFEDNYLKKNKSDYVFGIYQNK